jgi:hypothetical protein
MRQPARLEYHRLLQIGRGLLLFLGRFASRVGLKLRVKQDALR